MEIVRDKNRKPTILHFHLLTVFFALLACLPPTSQHQGISASNAKKTHFRSTSTEKIRLGLEKILFVIVSQDNAYHRNLAEHLRNDLKAQAKTLLPTASLAALPSGNGGDLLTVRLTHDEEEEIDRSSSRRRCGAWTILPILPHILAKWGEVSSSKANAAVVAPKSWVFFLQDNSVVDLRRLLKALSNKNPSKNAFMGRPLVDQRPTIIHHYAFWENVSEFLYPDFASGFFLSMPLIKILVPRWIKEQKGELDFSIDPKHELATFIWQQGKGITLQEMPELCGGRNSSSDCATFYNGDIPACRITATTFSASSIEDNVNHATPNDDNGDDMVMGVKTFHGFHAVRIPVIKETWETEAKRLTYFSDIIDEAIPTVDLGVNNTLRGHCAKTMAIFDFMRRHRRPYEWVVIVDDDTLISVRRLVRLLSCYDSNDLVALGERYGYGLNSEYGYDYITGGGGMVFSAPLVDQLVDCGCRKDDAPDDMHIGMCLSSLGVAVVHSPLFHQARPMDYAVGYLRDTKPLSFHKHEEHDPVVVWRQFLDDTVATSSSKLPNHDEL